MPDSFAILPEYTLVFDQIMEVKEIKLSEFDLLIDWYYPWEELLPAFWSLVPVRARWWCMKVETQFFYD